MPTASNGEVRGASKRASRSSKTCGAMELSSGPTGERQVGESDPLLNTDERPVFDRTLSRSRHLKRISEIHKEKSVFKNIFHYGSPHKANVSQRLPSQASSRGRSGRHSFLFSMLNPHSRSTQAIAFKTFIGMVILVDLVLFITSSSEKVNVPYAEGVVSCIFCLEYVLRLVTITESRIYSHPLWGRLAYMRTWSAVIDFFATVPWFVELLSGWDLPTLTYLRVFRLFRILKTEGYARAMDTVYRVVYYNAAILYVASLLCIYLVLFTAVLLYYFRPPDVEENSQFSNIASTMYLSALILTGQGGPDEEGLPWYTRAIVLITSVFCK